MKYIHAQGWRIVFSRYCQAYPITNKEAHTMTKVLLDQHFNVYGLPNQLHSDNGIEFVNNLWSKLFSEFKIQCTTTPTDNPSSNPAECFKSRYNPAKPNCSSLRWSTWDRRSAKNFNADSISRSSHMAQACS